MESSGGLSQTPIARAVRWVGYRWYVFLPMSLVVLGLACLAAFAELEGLTNQVIEPRGVERLGAVAAISLWYVITMEALVLLLAAWVGAVDRLVARLRRRRQLHQGAKLNAEGKEYRGHATD